jgi:Met-10+ like-protein
VAVLSQNETSTHHIDSTSHRHKMSKSSNGIKDDRDRGGLALVAYVPKKDAKAYKVALEDANLLHRDFRMTPGVEPYSHCIALPLLLSICSDREGSDLAAQDVKSRVLEALGSMADVDDRTRNLLLDVEGWGWLYCPYSTSYLGNHVHRTPGKMPCYDSDDDIVHQLTLVQNALLQAIQATCASAFGSQSNSQAVLDRDECCNKIQQLSIGACPHNIEMLGDDNTLVIPRKALDDQHDDAFRNLLAGYNITNDNSDSNGDRSSSSSSEGTESNGSSQPTINKFYTELWRILGKLYNSSRVVRKGEVDPNSAVRQSGYVLLWPVSKVSTTIPSGPSSPGWITVTEQGIRQSFDLTRVMFSRGNITEKIRFGHLVQPHEIVLDLYAGIGYFTLPALVHGQAEYVYSCEWNPVAAEYLLYNVRDNEVTDRVTVLQGDCRVIAREHKLVDMFDRCQAAKEAGK